VSNLSVSLLLALWRRPRARARDQAIAYAARGDGLARASGDAKMKKIEIR